MIDVGDCGGNLGGDLGLAGCSRAEQARAGDGWQRPLFAPAASRA